MQYRPDIITALRVCAVLSVIALMSAGPSPAQVVRQPATRSAKPPAVVAPAAPAAKTAAPAKPPARPPVKPTGKPATPAAAKPAEPPAPDYECRFTEDTIQIDGRADEAAWKIAQPIDQFRMPWVRNGSDQPRAATRAKLLWDRDYLYFFAEMDDSDVFADVKQHDGQTWNNDVIELFLKPALDNPGYYEFQVNALGTTLDMFIPRRNAGNYDRFKDDGDFDFPAAVQVKGTLNRWTDTDTGWSAEGRLAWKDFARTGGRPNPDERWTFAFCRYDYSVDFEGPALSTSAPLKTNPTPMFHYFEDYAPLRFVGPDQSPKSEIAKPYGIERLPALTTSRVVGSPDPPRPYTVQRIFETLPIEMPVTIARQPGSDLLWVVTQPWSYAPASLRRFKNAADVHELETLIPADGERAMYDICFHPKFADNGFVYIGSNSSFGGAKRSRVTCYHVDPLPPYGFAADSATTIIEWESDGHNGAAIAFGPDGMLYVTSGDGTSDSDQNLRGQNLAELTAKVLRIDVDKPEPGQMYRVPDDNPFVGQKNVRPETWAYGLRNPWRISIDADSNTVWVGNNGQDLWEQVYLIERGANYGWSVVEGTHDFYPDRQRGPQPISKPIADHPHSEARSLTGGMVYHGNKFPDLDGAYLYADYSTGKIWAIKLEGREVAWQAEIADTPLQITAIVAGNDGDIWLLDHIGSAIYRLAPQPAKAAAVEFPTLLSQSGLFKNVAEHVMAEGVIPYSVNAQLWSDGAYKERFLALPQRAGEDCRIAYTARGGWNLPNDTVLVKSFALDVAAGDVSTEADKAASRRWVETRFLVRQQNEWVGYSYKWNDDGTDAVLVGAQGTDSEYSVRDSAAPDGLRKQVWHYPSRAECMVCHSRAANYVLGLQTGQMNRDHDYGGIVDNQLRTLEHLGLFKVNWGGETYASERNALVETARTAAGAKAFDADVERDISRQADEAMGRRFATRDQRKAPKESPLLPQTPARLPRLADPLDKSAPLALRARSYLHSNCAQCHVEAGGGNSRIDLNIHTPLAKTHLIDEKPLHHTFGLGDARLIAPGAPERSVLLHRVAVRGAGQMPQLATAIVDDDAVKLLQAWIAEMEPPKK